MNHPPQSDQHRCRRCGCTKDEATRTRERNGPNGFGWYCRVCWTETGLRGIVEADPGRTPRKRQRRFPRGKRMTPRQYHLRYRYGLSEENVNSLIRAQGGLCAVCRTRPATQVDHCHTTGKVRGILCIYCNAAMGAFHDDPDLIRKAIAYLRRADDE